MDVLTSEVQSPTDTVSVNIIICQNRTWEIDNLSGEFLCLAWMGQVCFVFLRAVEKSLDAHYSDTSTRTCTGIPIVSCARSMPSHLCCFVHISGKTTILFALKTGRAQQTLPTVGFNQEEVTVDGVKLTIWDCGGQEKVSVIVSGF